MIAMPNGMPGLGAIVHQNTTTPVDGLSPGLQAPVQPAEGCSGAPQSQASSHDIALQASCPPRLSCECLPAMLS